MYSCDLTILHIRFDLNLSRREAAIATVKIVFPQHDERRLTLALVYMVIDLCVLSRNEKAEFAKKSPASQLAPFGALGNGN
jgi:hypothetical protein